MSQLKEQIVNLFEESLKQFSLNEKVSIELTLPSKPEFGDFATNIAMKLAKPLKKSPRDIAQKIIAIVEKNSLIDHIEMAGPGFINLRLVKMAWVRELKPIIDQRENYGKNSHFSSQRVLVEFVSANPTGPLHIGHGRGAVVGDTISRLLEFAGYDVDREYYVNDGGIQIQTLGRSVYLRGLELKGESIDFPEDAYQGDYIKDMAKAYLDEGLDENKNESDLIDLFGKKAGSQILEEIKQELVDLKVKFSHTFYESSLYEEGKVEEVIKKLEEKDLTYEKDGALWIKSSEFGDDKDRVLKKKDGAYTYLTPDIAYHQNKYDRGYDRIVNVWGGDHAGYGARLKAALKGLGHDTDKINLVFIQMVSLIQDGNVISMSTRKDEGEYLSDVVHDVGSDVTRYFFLMRSYQSQLEFDVDLARKTSSENPVYYIQYAHARICSIFEKAKEMNINDDEIDRLDHSSLGHINLAEEILLIQKILEFPDLIQRSALDIAPHRLANYALDLVKTFQSYYDKGKSDSRYKVLSDDIDFSKSKLYLLFCIRQVLRNTLRILGVSAPEKM